MTARHRHEFTALWVHFGPYGDQGVHYHPCFGEDCDRVIIGPNRECDGRPWGHDAFWLTEDGPKRRRRTAGAGQLAREKAEAAS